MALKIHEVKVIDISNDDTIVKALQEKTRRTTRKKRSRTFTGDFALAIRRRWPMRALC